MKSDTKKKVFELYEKNLVSSECYKKFVTNSNQNTLKEALRSQFTYDRLELNSIKVILFDSWNTRDTVFHHDEITILSQLLNNHGLLSRQELCRKIKLKPNSIKIAVESLVDEGAIIELCSSQNNKLVLIERTYFDKLLKIKKW